jgi:5-methylcytosine-specific restriction enzyme B
LSGYIFQLLDRESDHWSSYEVDLSDLELMTLFKLMGYKPTLNDQDITIQYKLFKDFFSEQVQKLRDSNPDGARLAGLLKQGKISLPPNLSILATINTSDESIYYLDSAFKRRWDWEYVESPTWGAVAPHVVSNAKLTLDNDEIVWWEPCIKGINRFICSNAQSIRRIEDKQVGWWFIKPEEDEISLQRVKDKLMFYLWDNVFAKDRRPIESLLAEKVKKPYLKLITFADFIQYTDVLMLYFESEGRDEF